MSLETAVRERQTLLEVLETRALAEPQKIAFTFHHTPPCTYGQLWREITAFGSYLLQKKLKPGERVIIALPNGSRFFYAFYGVQRAGGIAVPVFPGSGAERIEKLAHLCAAAFIVVPGTFPPEKIDRLKQWAGENHREIVLADGDSHFTPKGRFPEIAPQAISFIQFTSGSIASPKGVQLTHDNLCTNLEQMIAGMEITPGDVFVSWLPVYHDMGLILMTMVPFYLGAELVLLPAGLHYLGSWLKAIQERGGTFTAAPDFAYRLCLAYIKDPENYRLSRLRVALNAAEPVRSSTVNRFEERFGLKNVMLPAYGLAEATVGVCSGKPGKKAKVDPRGFVSVGSPFPGVQVRIMGEKGPAETGEIGEILVKSRANTSGYWQNPAATGELFHREGYIKTGDLGYVDGEGDYFVVGRKKNIIIQGGINIAAREVEELMDELPFVRRSAALGIDRGSQSKSAGTEGEQAYIFLEVNPGRSQMQRQETLVEITAAAVRCFDNAFGFRPGRVYLLKTGSIPMTYNGKIQYPRLKERYLDGTLRKGGFILFPDY